MGWPVNIGMPTGPFQGKEMPDGENLNTSDIVTVAEAIDRFDNMSPIQQRQWADKLEDLGLLEPGGYTYADLKEAWSEAVMQSADIYRATEGKRQVNPMGYLDLVKQVRPGQTFDPMDRHSNSSSSTSTQTNVSLTSKQDAKTLIRDAFQREVGRDPSRREMRAFFAAMRSKERANPSTSTTTSSNSESGVTRRKKNGNTNSSSTSTSSTSTTSKQAPSAGAIVENMADKQLDREADQFQTATGYYDALISMVRGSL